MQTVHYSSTLGHYTSICPKCPHISIRYTLPITVHAYVVKIPTMTKGAKNSIFKHGGYWCFNIEGSMQWQGYHEPSCKTANL